MPRVTLGKARMTSSSDGGSSHVGSGWPGKIGGIIGGRSLKRRGYFASMRSETHGGTGITAGNEGMGSKQPDRPVMKINPSKSPALLRIVGIPHLLTQPSGPARLGHGAEGFSSVISSEIDGITTELEVFSGYSDFSGFRKQGRW